jgi:hypothetical protein
VRIARNNFHFSFDVIESFNKENLCRWHFNDNFGLFVIF